MTERICDYESCYAVLHAMPLGVCLFDVDYKVRFWNRCLESWTKIRAEDIVGQSLGNFFPHLREPRFTTRFELLFQGGPPVIFSARLHGNIIPSTMPGGMARLQHTVARLLKEDGTGCTSVLLTMQDVTEAHMRLSDYARMHEQARHEIEMRIKAEAVLRESEERFSSAFEYAANGMALLGLDGILIKVNQALCSMLEYAGEDLTGTNMRDITLPEDAELGARHRERLLRGQTNAFQVEKRCVTRSGHVLWVLLSVSLVRDGEGNPLYFIAQIENVDKRKQLEAELYILATTDPLTAINNRREFLSRAEFELQRCRRQETMLAFLMVDIDAFKAINDSWGHAAGDEVLKAMVESSRAVLRTTDLFGRLGGEEFGIVLTDVDRLALEAIAERVRQAVAQRAVRTEHGTIRFTVSIGLAFFTEGLRTVDDLMRRADAALYEAKSRGRNRVCVAGDTPVYCAWPRGPGRGQG
jgi:diguanylate cyclase (GGDEF)-like protein/PAS domain S-box-containing protein